MCSGRLLRRLHRGLVLCARRPAELRRDYDLTTERRQRFADERFIGVRAVDFRRVEERHPAIDSGAEQRSAWRVGQGPGCRTSSCPCSRARSPTRRGRSLPSVRFFIVLSSSGSSAVSSVPTWSTSVPPVELIASSGAPSENRYARVRLCPTRPRVIDPSTWRVIGLGLFVHLIGAEGRLVSVRARSRWRRKTATQGTGSAPPCGHRACTSACPCDPSFG